ncbi:MAG: hypothetical protein FWC11_05405 [Firmicutes bacterium]|nr:hypothetical protein [Bacillota bacterium]
MKNEKTKRRIKTVIVIALVLLMLSTVGITFAFWASGTYGAEADRDININIGSGQTISTQLTLSDTTTPNLRLIPHDVPLREGETHEIRFDINVYWEGTGDNAASASAITGNLHVALTSIMINGTNFAGVEGRDGEDLFYVDIQFASTIVGNDTSATVVTIIITMEQTSGPAQYAQISGQEATFGFEFSVTV